MYYEHILIINTILSDSCTLFQAYQCVGKCFFPVSETLSPSKHAIIQLQPKEGRQGVLCAQKTHISMFAVLSQEHYVSVRLPVYLQLQYFDSLVLPILPFGSEVNGFENCDILEKLCI